MRKLLMGEARCQAFHARYYLLEEDRETPASYGVRIELEDEAASAGDLSPSRGRVEALTEKLVRGMVTPVGLRDVVDDWLLE